MKNRLHHTRINRSERDGHIKIIILTIVMNKRDRIKVGFFLRKKIGTGDILNYKERKTFNYSIK